MSRIRNADEFLVRFRAIQNDYDNRFAPHVARLRAGYTGANPDVDKILESHVRVYIVNSLLSALNWRMDSEPAEGLPNLVPEAAVESEGRGTTRFLDYLGVERESGKPLLVVETKRPNAILPQLVALSDGGYSEVIAKGLAGAALRSGWTGWIADMQDYVRSVKARTGAAPQRVLMTNGKWMILFLDPADAFLPGGTFDSSRILVFEDEDEVGDRAGELFLALEHSTVLKESPALGPGELAFAIRKEDADNVMHGLRLRYIEQRTIYDMSPVIQVAPIVFVRSRFGAWFRIEEPSIEFDVPHEAGLLPHHLREVEEASKRLLGRVLVQLGKQLKPISLTEHYGSEESFSGLRGVREVAIDDYLVTTGDRTHYLRPTPSVPFCSFHLWGKANQEGCAAGVAPIVSRSVQPRSFFFTAEKHHCAHRDVSAAKATPITPENRGDCGSRSGGDGHAFCEIGRFEAHLCCRTCAFEEVCTKAAVFTLPCKRRGSLVTGVLNVAVRLWDLRG